MSETAELAETAAARVPVAAGQTPVRQRARVLRRLVRRPSAATALVIIAVVTLAALLSPWLLADPNAVEVKQRFEPVSPAHLFGTDELGRDLLSRVANAGRLSLGIGFGSTLIAVALGAAWGMAAAAVRGWLDEVLMRLADAILAIPAVLFALVFVAAFEASPTSLTIIVGLLMTPLTARVMRASVLAELQSDYVRGLTAVGLSRLRILLTEVAPNAIPALLAQATLNVATAIMLEASLSFVGLGVQPPAASWGTLLEDGYSMLFRAVWYPLFPALVIIVVIGALNVIGDQLQKALQNGEGRS